MFGSILVILGLLLAAFLTLLQGLWYPGITGGQKADILLSDEKYPSRALLGIGLLDESTLSALKQKSADFRSLSSAGRAMVTHIAVCESGQRFVSFARDLSNSTDDSIRQIGRLALAHRGLTSTVSITGRDSLTLFAQKKEFGDLEQLQVARDVLANPPQRLDSQTQIQVEEMIRTRQLRPELAAAALLSMGVFSQSRSTTLLTELVAAPQSPYRIPAFWALHFSNHLEAVSAAQKFLSTQSEYDSNSTLLRVEIQRAGKNVQYPTAYSEYLCR